MDEANYKMYIKDYIVFYMYIDREGEGGTDGEKIFSLQSLSRATALP